MKYVRTFEGYKNYKSKEENLIEKYSILLEGVELSNNENELFINVFNKFLKESKLEESIKQEIENYISTIEYDSVNEAFWDKLKERFPKAAEVSKVLSNKAEAALGKIIKSVKDAVSFVKKIGESIKEFFLSVIEKGKTFFTEQIQNGKLKDKIEELTKTKKEGLVADLKTSKEVINFYRKEFMGKLLGSADKNMTDMLSKEQEPVAESVINEGKNVISTLVHKVEEIPPFSWLHKVAQAGEAGATAVVKSISNVTQKLGGPAFELPVIVLLVGIVIEQMVKGSVGHWLIDLAGSATPLGMAIKGIKTVAFFVALIVALDATVGEKILGGHGDHGDSHGEKKEGESKPVEGKEEAPKEEAPKEEAPKEEAPKEEAPKEEAPKEDEQEEV
jgi:hypothetical protein